MPILARYRFLCPAKIAVLTPILAAFGGGGSGAESGKHPGFLVDKRARPAGFARGRKRAMRSGRQSAELHVFGRDTGRAKRDPSERG